MDDVQREFVAKTQATLRAINTWIDDLAARGGVATPGEIELLEALKASLRQSREIISEFGSDATEG